MTLQNPLDILRQFSPTAQGITSQFGAGQVAESNRMANQQQEAINPLLLEQQRLSNEAGRFDLDQGKQQAAAGQESLKTQANIKSTVNNLVRLNTAFDQGATPEQLAQMLQQNIQNTPPGGNPADSQEALQVLQTQGVEGLKNLAGQATAQFQNAGLIKQPKLETIETGEGIGVFNGATGKITIAEGAPITPAQFKAQQQSRFDQIAADAKLVKDKQAQSDMLRNEVTKLATDLKFKDTFAAFNRISASNDGSAAGDLALIFNYMKMLDPGSTVREGEFATAQNSEGVPGRVVNLWNNLLSGERLNTKQRASFTDQASKIFDKSKAGFESTARPILNIGKSRGLTQDEILGEGFFESFTVTDENPAPEQEPPPVTGQPEVTTLVSPGGVNFTIE
jgi:hypothetical protein